MPPAKLDFDLIARRALQQGASLLAAWFPQGKPDGVEWRVGGLDGAPGQSLAVNLATGVWCDFAGDESDKGSDLISLYAAIHGLDQGAAARDVAQQLGVSVPPLKERKGARSVSSPPGALPAKTAPDSRPASQGIEGVGSPAAASPATGAPAAAGSPPGPPASGAPPVPPGGPPPGDPPGGGAGSGDERRTPWRPILPVPEGAGDPPRAHSVRGLPEASWCYRDRAGQVLGYVCRFKTSDGGKEVLPMTFCEHEKTGARAWRWISFPEPRPLYGLEHLGETKTVLVVEGEKCADAARTVPLLIEHYDIVTWPGGGKAVSRANWGALAGRKVLGWPDCDAKLDKKTQALLPAAKQPGIKAMETIAQQVAARGGVMRLVKIAAPGAKPDGWDIADAIAEGQTGEEILAFLKANQRPPASLATEGPPVKTPREMHPTPENWEAQLIRKKGELAACVANVYDILRFSPEWAGVVAYDEFAQRTVKLTAPPYEGGKLGDWDSIDDTHAAMWISRRYDATPSSLLITESIEVLARRYAFHPVRDWLRSLSWDKTHRIDHWLEDYLGVPQSEYSRRVARWFLIGMVARVMDPGVKFDYCLVLEGPQGEGKSTMLRILAGDWFGDADLDLANKDSMSALRGKWLWEFAELGALARSEERRQKSFLSRQVDEFRPVYGRREIKLPRQIAFSGTTNEWEWNKDPTGGRRFWPVYAGELRPDVLRQVRGQLFAEAYLAYLAEERFWPTIKEQREIFDPEQLKREQQESLVDALHDWVFARTKEFSIADAAIHGLTLDAGKLTRDLQTRIGIALRKLGCERVEKRNGMVRYWYKPPKKTAMSDAPAGAASTSTVGNVAPPHAAGSGDDDDSIPF